MNLSQLKPPSPEQMQRMIKRLNAMNEELAGQRNDALNLVAQRGVEIKELQGMTQVLQQQLEEVKKLKEADGAPKAAVEAQPEGPVVAA